MNVENIKLIPLTQGKHAIVDAADYSLISQCNWYLDAKGYARNCIYIGGGRKNTKNKTILMHRIIMVPPSHMEVDHINGNRLDNRRSNLRLCTQQQNVHNQRQQIGKSSEYKGVSKVKNRDRYVAYISLNGKRKWLGYYISEIEAALAYNEAAKRLHGDFAHLNKME